MTGIGGVFLRARDPEALAGWYEANLGLELEPWKGSVLRSSGGETLIWSLFEASTDYFGRVDQQAMVNYRVDDLDAALRRLRDDGMEVAPEVDKDDYGRFAWGIDPEGNRFELWQPPPGR